jgi:hypothetical protein
MKSVVHPDGVRRVTVKVETCLDAHLMTVYALHTLIGEPNAVDLLKGCNKREIFALARASIQGSGQDTARVEVPSKITQPDLDAAELHVRSCFPEID